MLQNKIYIHTQLKYIYFYKYIIISMPDLYLTTGAFQVSTSSGGSTISVTGTATGDFYVSTPLDITGYTIDADVKGLITNTLVGTFTPTITSATDGAFELMMSPATALAIDVGSYGWDVSLTQSGGERYYWVTGVATVQRTYSRT